MKNYSLIVICLAIPCLCLAEPSRVEHPPNIIIFLADDMGLGDTSAYQDWTKNPDSLQLSTPAMERLANKAFALRMHTHHQVDVLQHDMLC